VVARAPVRVSMAPGTDYVDLLTKSISRRYTEVPFKVTISSSLFATTSVASALRELDIALTSIFAGHLRERDTAKRIIESLLC
jgi:hypothetical protein